MTAKRTVLTLIAVAVLAGGAGAAFWAARPDPQPVAAQTTEEVEIDGTLTLRLPDFVWNESPLVCAGHDGYDDITQGAQVTVTDPARKVIAVGALGVGKPTVDGDRASACVLPFHMYAPAGHDFYGIEVSHRGVVQFEPGRLSSVNLTLG